MASGVLFRPYSGVSRFGFKADSEFLCRETSSGFSFAGKLEAGKVLPLRSRAFDFPLQARNFSRDCGFSNNGHLQYYVSPRSGGKKEKSAGAAMAKKKKKLIKGLSKRLTRLSTFSFDVETGDDPNREARGRMISEAAAVLLSHLAQHREEEKERKSKKERKSALCTEDDTSSSSDSSESECEEKLQEALKTNPKLVHLEQHSEEEEERKSKKESKAALCTEDSTSSSSDSSESECEEKIKEALKTNPLGGDLAVPQINVQQTTEEEAIKPVANTSTHEEHKKEEVKAKHCGCSSSSIAQQNDSSSVSALRNPAVGKIEVCMGGKCKKSGAVELLGELGRMAGAEGTVVGCKCMGKCRDGPNVRLVRTEEATSGSRTKTLCTGVGMKDVGEILADFLGKPKQDDLGILPA